jgi:hypothetical protein
LGKAGGERGNVAGEANEFEARESPASKGDRELDQLLLGRGKIRAKNRFGKSIENELINSLKLREDRARVSCSGSVNKAEESERTANEVEADVGLVEFLNLLKKRKEFRINAIANPLGFEFRRADRRSK